MASCVWCKREISRGTEATKAITTYRKPNGEEVDVGFDREVRVAEPGWKIVRIAHYKHYRTAEKREKRGGDPVTGRGMGAIPTAYEVSDISQNQTDLERQGIAVEDAKTTQYLSDRVSGMRKDAIEWGTGTDDWKHKERTRAEEHGGPYDHKHYSKFDIPAHLLAHLEFAHGWSGEDEPEASHSQLHAQMAQRQIEESRAQDKGDRPVTEADEAKSDWRDQQVVEASAVPEVLRPEDLLS